MCARLVRLLAHQDESVRINSVGLLGTICSDGNPDDVFEAVLGTQVGFAAVRYLEGIANSAPARMATDEMKGIHNACKFLSGVVGYLLQADRLSDVMVYLEQHRLLEVLTKLLRSHTTTPQLHQLVDNNGSYRDAIAGIFLFLEDLATITTRPAFTEQIMALLPLALEVCVSELHKSSSSSPSGDKGDAVNSNKENEAEDDEDEEGGDEFENTSSVDAGLRSLKPSDLAVSAVACVFSLPVFLPFDLGPSGPYGIVSDDDNDDEQEKEEQENFKHRRKPDSRSESEKADEVKTRLSLFVRICGMIQDADTMRLIFSKFVDFEAFLCEHHFQYDRSAEHLDDDMVELVNAAKIGVRGITLLRFVAENVTAQAKELYERRKNPWATGSTSNNNGATKNNGKHPARRDRTSDDGAEQLSLLELKSRAAQLLLDILGDPDTSVIFRGCLTIVNEGSDCLPELIEETERLVEVVAEKVWCMETGEDEEDDE